MKVEEKKNPKDMTPEEYEAYFKKMSKVNNSILSKMNSDAQSSRWHDIYEKNVEVAVKQQIKFPKN